MKIRDEGTLNENYKYFRYNRETSQKISNLFFPVIIDDGRILL